MAWRLTLIAIDRGSEFYFSGIIWPLSICIFSLTNPRLHEIQQRVELSQECSGRHRKKSVLKLVILQIEWLRIWTFLIVWWRCYVLPQPTRRETHAIRNSRMKAMFQIWNKFKNGLLFWRTDGVQKESIWPWCLQQPLSEQPKFSETGLHLLSRSKHSTGSTMNNICKITILLKFYIMIFIGQHPLICKQSIKGLIMVTLSIINALNFDKVQYS